MSALQLEAYEMLKDKLGQREANLFVEYVESKVEKQVELQTKVLATNKELILAKEELFKEIVSVRGEIENVRSEIAIAKADLNKTIYLVGLIQFLAIVGSVLAIVHFMLK